MENTVPHRNSGVALTEGSTVGCILNSLSRRELHVYTWKGNHSVMASRVSAGTPASRINNPFMLFSSLTCKCLSFKTSVLKRHPHYMFAVFTNFSVRIAFFFYLRDFPKMRDENPLVRFITLQNHYSIIFKHRAVCRFLYR